MTILDRILPDVRRELAEAMEFLPRVEVERRALAMPPAKDFAAAIGASEFGLIAEVKRRSPSAGDMRRENVDAAPQAYEECPAVCAISVLTNRTHFGGGIDDLEAIAQSSSKPVLRKDFILDPYQVFAARAAGADAILLMANVLKETELRDLHALCLQLGMEALFEVHELAEIAILPSTARVVGINSRKFKSHDGFVEAGESTDKDFTLDYSAFELADKLPAGCLRVAESGISPATIGSVVSHFDAALVGTSLLRDPRGIHVALDDFTSALAGSAV